MEPEPLVDVKRLKELYGNPESWWYQAAETGRVPSYRIGKYRKFRLSEVEAWIKEQRQGPQPA
jgi:excisionase family DNA binding protein